MKEQIQALSKFNITDKPKGISSGRGTKYNDLMVALENLANDKSISLTHKDLMDMFQVKFVGFRQAMCLKGKKAGMKIKVVEANGLVHVFRSN